MARLLSLLKVFRRQPTPAARVALSYFHPEPGRAFCERGDGSALSSLLLLLHADTGFTRTANSGISLLCLQNLTE